MILMSRYPPRQAQAPWTLEHKIPWHISATAVDDQKGSVPREFLVGKVGWMCAKVVFLKGRREIPSWELTYPIPAGTFEDDFPLSQGGIC